jgi:hypothetical protein
VNKDDIRPVNLARHVRSITSALPANFDVGMQLCPGSLFTPDSTLTSVLTETFRRLFRRVSSRACVYASLSKNTKIQS